MGAASPVASDGMMLSRSRFLLPKMFLTPPNTFLGFFTLADGEPGVDSKFSGSGVWVSAGSCGSGVAVVGFSDIVLGIWDAPFEEAVTSSFPVSTGFLFFFPRSGDAVLPPAVVAKCSAFSCGPASDCVVVTGCFLSSVGVFSGCFLSSVADFSG